MKPAPTPSPPVTGSSPSLSSSPSSSNLLSPLSLHERLARGDFIASSKRLVERPAFDAKDHKLIAKLKAETILRQLLFFDESLLREDAFQALSQYLRETEDLTYDNFVTLRSIFPENAKKYFTAKVFIYLRPNPLQGSIQSAEFIRFIHRSLLAEQTFIALMRYTVINSDMFSVTQEQLQQYILRECLFKIDPNHKLDESFHEYYLFTAASKFFFYLDTRNANEIQLRKLIHSEVMQELQTMIQLQQYNDSEFASDESVEAKMDSNWFSPENVINIYTTFLKLDSNQNGLVSLDEVEQFLGFSNDPLQFTQRAWQRIYEELIIFEPFELDYRAFVKLTLALDDINQPVDNLEVGDKYPEKERKNLQGLKFFWNVIDYDRSGYLSPIKIKFFYEEVQTVLDRNGLQVPGGDEIVSEIYDILAHNPSRSGEQSPKGYPTGPSFNEIIQSNQAEMVLMMLLDVNAFWRYENRESLITMPMGDGEDAAGGEGAEAAAGETADDVGAAEASTAGAPSSFSSGPIKDETAVASEAAIASSAVKKINFSQIMYDDEDSYDDDYEF